MIVRDATLSDLPELLIGAKKMHEESRYHKFNYNEDKVYQLLYVLILSDDGIVLVAEDNNLIVGGLVGFISEHFFGNDKSATDFAFFVNEDNRGTVASIFLAKEYISKAKAKGIIDIGLSNVSGYKPKMVDKFYKKLGFAWVGGNYFLED